MANDVEFSVPRRTLGRSDISFRVKKDGSVFGTLKVSNGSLVWFPRKTKVGRRMGWRRFDRVMRENSIGKERR